MYKKIIILNAIALFSINSAVAANTYFEARNDAMGGTGVASSHYSIAPLANPALLTKYQKNDHGSILLPAAGADASANPSVKKLLNFFNQTTDITNNASNGSGQNYQDTAKKLRQKLETLQDGVSTNLNAGVATVIAIPNDTVSVAFSSKVYVVGAGALDINQNDIDILKEIEKGNENIDPNTVEFASKLSGEAAVIGEVGLSFAKGFETYGQAWSIGVTPKLQSIYAAATDHTFMSQDQLSPGFTQSLGFNADIGAYTDFYDNWTVGLSIINIIPRSIDVKSDRFNVRPQATTGIAWNYKLVNAAFDLDLSPASGFKAADKKQFASLGAEFDLYKWAQLRAGYKYNMRSNSGSAFTFGIGLSPFDIVHFDLTAVLSPEDSYGGAVAQIKITF